MSAHTPGPWMAERFGVVSADIGGKRYQVAAATGQAPMHGDPTESTEKIQEANARLIAAAPELLSLLQELVKAGNANTRAAKRLVNERLAAGFFADVRAAIAKATGGAK